jgi:hypothetical protein
VQPVCHFSKDCVSKGGAQKPLTIARVYMLVLGESKGGSEVVTSTVPILGLEASVLLDSGLPTDLCQILHIWTP